MAIMFILGLVSGIGITFGMYVMVHSQLIEKGKMYLDHEED
jgi:aminoglycoside N3'-acetyltransferase